MQWLEQTTVKPLEDFDELGQLYDRMVGQWRTEMTLVANAIGGVSSPEKYGSQPGPGPGLPRSQRRGRGRRALQRAYVTQRVQRRTWRRRT